MVDEPVRILVVGRDAERAANDLQWLSVPGVRVERLADGEAAAEQLAAAPPDVLVADWDAPPAGALALCQRARQTRESRHVHVLLLGPPGEAAAVKALESGADDYAPRGVSRRELTARVRTGVRHALLERRWRRLAGADPITGLATQRAFCEQLRKEWARSERGRYPTACVMVDIDYFKRVNDTFGHAAGDEVIRKVAAALEANCRASDVVGRYGGEEFCVLLPETNEEQAVRWAERARRAVAEQRVEWSGRTIGVTASFGAAQRMADTRSAEELLDLADQALLVAKRSGRDRVVGYRSMQLPGRLPEAEDGAGALLAGLAARDVMTPIVGGLDQEDTVGNAVRYFLRLRVNSAPVVDRGGRLVGILAESDVMASMFSPNWSGMKIREVMKRNVVCYEDDTPVLAIYEFLCRAAIRGVVVVADGQPQGMITRTGLLRWFTNSLHAATPGGEDRRGRVDPDPAARRRVLLAVQALRREAEELERRLASETDALACLIGGATRVEELVQELLACSQNVAAAPSPAGGAAGAWNAACSVRSLADESGSSV